MSEQKHYGHYDDSIMDDHWYATHVNALTAEKLHSKGQIAAELAYRDKRIAALEAAQRWIPYSERFPEYQRVLTYTPNQHISIEYRIIPEGIMASDATHWMPLPAPPREAE